MSNDDGASDAGSSGNILKSVILLFIIHYNHCNNNNFYYSVLHTLNRLYDDVINPESSVS